jgi:hypothetical protein
LKLDDAGVGALVPDPQLSEPRPAVQPVRAADAGAALVVEGKNIADPVSCDVGRLNSETLVGRAEPLQQLAPATDFKRSPRCEAVNATLLFKRDRMEPAPQVPAPAWSVSDRQQGGERDHEHLDPGA